MAPFKPPSSVRASKRLKGEEAERPPPPSVASSGTTLRSLLATDSRHGQAVYDTSPNRAWNLDGRGAFSPRSLFEEAEEAFEAEEAEAAVKDKLPGITNDNDSESEDEDDEDDDEEEEQEDEDSDDDASTTLLPSPAKKKEVKENVVPT